ncbi:nuclear transport factor 2 family protein [Amycolatopsis sp. VC5-11]|uniref:nuclear transport factor 2 family protein n=1 Tax=Amycolatopsis sp. VC5-11 TaxID=3120156 RepID=UPI0030082BE7
MSELRERADQEAAELVERFAEAWSRMDPDAFTPLFQPGVRLIHPLERNTRGVAEAREFMTRTMNLVPDLRYDVQGWASGSGQVLIWGRLYGTLGGGPIEWPLVDRIVVEDGLIAERTAYFDPLVIIGAVLRRPRAWLPYLGNRLRRFRAGRGPGNRGGVA